MLPQDICDAALFYFIFIFILHVYKGPNIQTVYVDLNWDCSRGHESLLLAFSSMISHPPPHTEN